MPAHSREAELRHRTRGTTPAACSSTRHVSRPAGQVSLHRVRLPEITSAEAAGLGASSFQGGRASPPHSGNSAGGLQQHQPRKHTCRSECSAGQLCIEGGLMCHAWFGVAAHTSHTSRGLRSAARLACSRERLHLGTGDMAGQVAACQSGPLVLGWKRMLSIVEMKIAQCLLRLQDCHFYKGSVVTARCAGLDAVSSAGDCEDPQQLQHHLQRRYAAGALGSEPHDKRG